MNTQIKANDLQKKVIGYLETLSGDRSCQKVRSHEEVTRVCCQIPPVQSKAPKTLDIYGHLIFGLHAEATQLSSDLVTPVKLHPIVPETPSKAQYATNDEQESTITSNMIKKPALCRLFGGKCMNLVDLAGFEPAASSVRLGSRSRKRWKKLSITSILFQNHYTVIAYLLPIVPELFPICIGMKRGKAIRSPVQIGI
jgi:hypothetical protein